MRKSDGAFPRERQDRTVCQSEKKVQHCREPQELSRGTQHKTAEKSSREGSWPKGFVSGDVKDNKYRLQ